MSGKPRQMVLVAFLQAQNCSNYPGSWRHPASASDFLTPHYYQRIARVLEEGKFHLAFFDDRLAIPDTYQDSYEATVRHGIRSVKMDLIPILTAMGLATRHLGLGGTYSTTYYEPFHVARTFATLDLMVGGRAAWNVVTSLNDSEAANFGRAEHPPHDLRYDRADEFMEVVLGHWGTWADDAIVLDKASKTFADPAKVRRLDHDGTWFRSRGPFTVPRSPQGHPVVIQAGQSGRGKAFAARWGELLFTTYQNIASGQEQYRALKSEIAGLGRDPGHVTIAPAFYPIVGETRAIAEEKAAVADATALPVDGFTLLSEVTNFDFSRMPQDRPLTPDDLEAMNGMQALRDRVVQSAGRSDLTPLEFMQISKRGTIREIPLLVGSPQDVADQLEAWFVGEACDGFVICATHMPGAYEDFVRLVVPELQRRGLFQREYRGSTLRENLGLPRPAARGEDPLAGEA